MSKTEKAQKMKADVEKKKIAVNTLKSLNGLTPSQMSKSQRDAYDVAIGILLNVLNSEGRVDV